MKKLLVFFMVLFGISLGAMATPKDYKAADGFICAKVDSEVKSDGTPVNALKGQNAKIQLFFDTGSKTSIGLHDGCEALYKEIYADVQKVADDIEELVYVGSADQQNRSGNSDLNRDLAKRRANYAYKVLGGGIGWRIHVAGDEDAKTYSPTVDNQVFRSVSVYVIWRLAQCPEKFVEKLSAYEKELTDALSKYPKDKNKIENALAGVKKAKELCAPGKTLTAGEVEQLLDEVYGMLIIAGDVVTSVQVINTEIGIDVSYQENSIDLQYSKLDSLRRGLGLSVWRDEEGKFNTARLISDSVAGVVLGTVGGIVTSKLVKKNQLKKGFEDLYCAIGGQTVAEYGDDFTVGLR
ncbi:MAG: hypothetical protein J5714_04615 [Alphaproteobacteria bacterium]|nr:hypothetical protein [Alphaproteobacteria bacterium]